MRMRIIKLDKTPYENGEEIGKIFKNEIHQVIEQYEKLSQDKNIWRKCEISLNKLKQNYPDYYEEIKGKANGADVDFNAYWVMMCPEILELNDHCTTIMCRKANGNFILSHNEDDAYTKSNYCISKVYTNNGWFATNDIYHMPFGNGFSWNSHGIIKTINYCFEPNICDENISRYFSQRHISEANSIEDLIKRCKDIKVASGYHINAIDYSTNIAVSIEVYPDGVDVEYIYDNYFHSNHYIHKKYEDKPQTDKNSNSIFRLNKTKELFSSVGNVDINIIKSILKYRDETDSFEYSIFQTEKDPYLTGMNFSFDIDNKDIIYLDIYPTNEELILPYDLG